MFEKTIADIKKRIVIDKTDLDKELCEQSAFYLYVSEKAVIAEQVFRDAKVDFDARAAKIAIALRTAMSEAGEKVTDKIIESQLLKHPEYISMQKRLNLLIAQKEGLKVLRESAYQRKDCLIQLAISRRGELNSLCSSVKES